MRFRRLAAALILTAAALAIAAIWIRAAWPRSGTTEATAVHMPAATATPAGERLVIPSIGVNALVVSAGWDAEGNMAAPGAPDEVAWYDFTSRPGTAGNATMAGHFAGRDGVRAAFANLANLAPGDSITFIDAAGNEVHYRVVAVDEIDAFTTDVEAVIQWTEPESLTLITCSGEFVWTALTYSTRTVVRAERVPTPGM
jgi:LPXTG-site transpeptidase (sortase) family protein